MNKATSFYAIGACFHIDTNQMVWCHEPQYTGFLEFLAAKNADWRIAGDKNDPVIVILDSPTRATTMSVEKFINEYIADEVLAYWNEYEALSQPAPKYYACSAAQRVVQLTDEERAKRTSTTIEVLPNSPFIVGAKVVQTNLFRVGRIIDLEPSSFMWPVIVDFGEGSNFSFSEGGEQIWNTRKGRVLYVCAEQ